MTIETELLALKNPEGFIVAEEAVEWAQGNPTSKLHGCLEWDDATAGHNWRVWQVRRLIAIHIVSGEGVRQTISLTIDRSRDGGGYREMGDVLPVKSLRDAMMEDALRDLDRVQARYKMLQDLAEIWAAKDKVKSRRGARRAAGVAAGASTTAA